MQPVAPDLLAALAALALDCVEREYPNQVVLSLRSPADLILPRALTPAFYGCFDWHSAVHGHWLLARAARLAPEQDFAVRARDLLERHLAADALALELAHLRARPTFERPYGLAWLLRLHQELATWQDDSAASRWAAHLEPLAALCARRLCEWLGRLTHPIRSGVHSQTAFAMGLALDWARAVGSEHEAVLLQRALSFHAADRACALHLEPSGEDFLSPSLAAADLLRRVLSPAELAQWLGRALPDLSGDPIPLAPHQPADRSDGRLAHLDGLSLSRAWMLLAVARRLPPGDARRAPLERCAESHARSGLAAIRADEYMGAHWLGSFALYLLSEVGFALSSPSGSALPAGRG